MKRNKKDYLLWTIFTAIGVSITIIGIIIFACISLIPNKKQTTGQISEIIYDFGPNGNRNAKVIYEVEGEKKESYANGFSSTWHEGDKIDIYYNPDKPEFIRVKYFDALYLIMPSVGLIFAIIGITGLSVIAHKNKIEKNLKENGERVYATYVETIVNYNYRINYRHPYIIICEWNNSADGKKYIFKSNNIWFNPENILREKNIQQFTVYIDRDNMKHYVVDTDFLYDSVVDLS